MFSYNDTYIEGFKPYNPNLTEFENKANYVNGQVLSLLVGSKSLVPKPATIDNAKTLGGRFKSFWDGLFEGSVVSGSGGGKIYDMSWTPNSPNFKNGIYELLKDADSFGSVVQLSSVSGKIRLPNGFKPGGNYDFVLTESGNIKFGEAHSFIAGTDPVRYAGTIDISPNSGTINGWKNHSGHYEPNMLDVEGIELAAQALKNKFPNMDIPIFSPHNN